MKYVSVLLVLACMMILFGCGSKPHGPPSTHLVSCKQVTAKNLTCFEATTKIIKGVAVYRFPHAISRAFVSPVPLHNKSETIVEMQGTSRYAVFEVVKNSTGAVDKTVSAALPVVVVYVTPKVSTTH